MHSNHLGREAAQNQELVNPPIVEATIEFQLRLPDDASVDKLNKVAAAIESEYPIELRRRIAVVSSVIAGNKFSSNVTEDSVEGLLRKSVDELQVVQLMKGRFAFSRLVPYQGWNNLQSEAKQLWEIYRKILRPIQVTKIAIRYINKLLLPSYQLDFDDYLTISPQTPAHLPNRLSGFMQRVSVTETDIKAAASIQLLFEGADEVGKHIDIPVILDIDTLKQGNYDPNDNEIWDDLELLRIYKNKIFFGCITKNTVGLFNG